MSETLYMRTSTQNIACSQRQMNTCHTSFSYILWAYGEHIMSKWSSRTSDQFVWLVSEKKTEAVREKEGGRSGGRGGGGGRQDWSELYGWHTIHTCQTLQYSGDHTPQLWKRKNSPRGLEPTFGLPGLRGWNKYYAGFLASEARNCN